MFYQIFLILFIIFLVGFIITMVLHKRKIKAILKSNDYDALGESKLIRQPYLAAANLFLAIGFAFFVFTMLQLQIPFEIIINALHVYNYKNEIALAIDVFSTAIIVVVFTSIYPIMRHKKAVQDWFEFASGALIGSGFTLLFFPFFAAFFILTVIFYMIAFGGRATRYYGLLFGFSIMIVLRFFIPLGFIFWLSYAFWLGLLFGCALLFRSRSSLFIWSLPLLLLIPNFFFSS